MIQPIFILRYIYGGAFAFDESTAITYVDYTDMVARWDITIDATPPTLIAYTAIETLLNDMYTVYQSAHTRVSNYFEFLSYSFKIGAPDMPTVFDFIEATQKQKTRAFLLKEEDEFYYSVTVNGQSSFVLNEIYFIGFINYNDLVTLFNLYSYEQLLNYGYEWLYEVGQFLSETFSLQDARDMLSTIYYNEIRDNTYPLENICE